MERVKGIGGVFFRSKDNKALAAWYRDHLGIQLLDWGGSVFDWEADASETRPGSTAWCVFDTGSDHFGNANTQFLINYRVDNLDAMLEQLRSAGVTVDDQVQDSEQGRFGWAWDPDGNRFELWEPPANERA